MEYDVVFLGIKEQLRKKYPEVEDFSLMIADRLGMDRRGVKRRLNGEIRFSLSEVFDVAREFGLSLDRIYVPKDDKQNFLELFGYEYQLNGVEENIQRVQDIYRLACQSEESFVGLATLSLPTIFWYKQEWARTLFFYIWSHNLGTIEFPSLAEARENRAYTEVINRFVAAVTAMKSSVYIVSPEMLKEACDMISLFYKMNIFSYQDVLHMSEDLSLLLTSFEEMCITGTIPETGNKIAVYVLQRPVKNDFMFIESSNINCGCVYMLGLYPLATVNSKTFDSFKSWFRSMLKSSMLISESNELERSVFFERQRAYVSQMLASL
ncbi:MAG: hypothetical protein LUF04_12890 [Bacteroides sp.]|nr:hypothetical protein [Bacteroides sp.]